MTMRGRRISIFISSFQHVSIKLKIVLSHFFHFKIYCKLSIICMKRNNCLYFFINTSSVLSLTEFLLGFFFISNFNNNLFIILFVQTKCHRCQSGKGSTASEYEKVFILLYIYKSYL